jgi:hypothetical protein
MSSKEKSMKMTTVFPWSLGAKEAIVQFVVRTFGHTQSFPTAQV